MWVWVCVCVCLWVCVCMGACVCMCMHMSMCICLSMCMHVSVSAACACVLAFVLTCTCACAYVFKCSCMCRCMYVSGLHARVRVYVYNILHNITSLHAALQQSCQWETFQASCTSPDHVIVMQRAQYGRMRRGRCVKRDFGYIGCAANVLSLADQLCSGRTKCNVPVYGTFGHLRPCSELESYFEATFACVEGTKDMVWWDFFYERQSLF